MAYVCDKMKTRENRAPLYKEKGNLVFWDLEMVEMVNNFFVSVFTGKCSSHTAWAIHTEGKGKDCKNKELPAVREDQIWDHLRIKMMHKPMEPDKTNLWVPRKQVEEVAKLLPIFEKPLQFPGVLSDW